MLRILLLAIVAALALAAPFYFYSVTLMTIMCFIVFACSFNLLLGYTGLLCFGHAMFFGGAAYITGYILKTTAMPTEIAILAGGAAAGLLGVVIGFLTMKRQGIQFAMITLAFSQFIYFIFLQAPFTGGEDGMQAIPRNPLLGFVDIGSNLNFYYVVLAFTALSIFIYYRVVHSPFGEVLKAVRDNQPRVEFAWVRPGEDKAGRLRDLGFDGRHRGWHEGDRLPVRDVDRRVLAGVGRGHPDDAARRARHADRSGLWSGGHHSAQ